MCQAQYLPSFDSTWIHFLRTFTTPRFMQEEACCMIACVCNHALLMVGYTVQREMSSPLITHDHRMQLHTRRRQYHERTHWFHWPWQHGATDSEQPTQSWL